MKCIMQMYFLLLIILSSEGNSEKIKIFKAMDTAQSSLMENPGARLLQPSQKSVTDLSLCFRFFNYKIQNQFFMSRTSINCNLCWDFYSQVEWSQDGSKLLLYQSFNWRFVDLERKDTMWRLTPMEWHTYCFTYDQRSRQRIVYIDGEIILADTMDINEETTVKDWFADKIIFLEKSYEGWSRTDMMTDINFWNVSLRQEDIKNWTKCRGNLEEFKYVDWRASKWETKDVDVDHMNESMICQDKTKADVYSFRLQKTFLESVDFCHLLGGRILVTGAKESITVLPQLSK